MWVWLLMDQPHVRRISFIFFFISTWPPHAVAFVSFFFHFHFPAFFFLLPLLGGRGRWTAYEIAVRKNRKKKRKRIQQQQQQQPKKKQKKNKIGKERKRKGNENKKKEKRNERRWMTKARAVSFFFCLFFFVRCRRINYEPGRTPNAAKREQKEKKLITKTRETEGMCNPEWKKKSPH